MPVPQEKKLFVGRAGEPVPAIFARGLLYNLKSTCRVRQAKFSNDIERKEDDNFLDNSNINVRRIKHDGSI